MLARSLLWVAVALAVAAVIASLAASNGSARSTDLPTLLLGPVPFLVCGVIVWVRRPELRMARIILLVGVAMALAVSGPRLIEAAWIGSGPLPWLWAGVVAEQTMIILAVVLGIAMLGLLPDGTPHARIERWTVAAPVGLLAVPILAVLSDPSVFAAPWAYEEAPVLASPVYVPALAALHAPLIAVYAATPIVGLAGVALLARRYRIADGPVRRQLRWLLVGGLLSIGSIAAAVALHTVAEPLSDILWFLPLTILAVAISGAAVRHRSAGLAAIPADDGSRAHDIVRRLAGAIVAFPRVSWSRVTLDGGATAEAGSRPDRMATADLAVRRDGRTLGTVTVGFDPASPPDAAERSILEMIVDQAAIAIASARLASRVVQAEEATRRAIERDIHDGVQQSIVAHLARLELVRRRLEAGEADPAEITELQRDVGGILDELRDLARGIHPPVLADMGLADAVAERAARMPIPVRIGHAAPSPTRRFPAEVESTAYFIVCEAFANVLKHAGARSVDVDIHSDVSFLRLAVEDDGRGFDPAATPLRGLDGLIDRAAALGGELVLHSRPGQGTAVRAALPLDLRI